jgi:predicted TIM-barrel fold metal-dependent hydrolase
VSSPTATPTRAGAAPRTASPRVDVDVHNALPSLDVLFPYLSEFWLERLRVTSFTGAYKDAYPPSEPASAREGTQPAGGARAGSDRELLTAQALDGPGMDYAILNLAYAAETIYNPDAATALTAAINDWQIEHWLEAEPRFRGSICVAPQIPELAVAEIERVGDHPGFVQVNLPARPGILYGRRDYHKVFAAAVEHGLVVSLQYGGFAGVPTTSVGWPSYRIEDYVGMASAVQSQLVSLIAEGVFDRFPELMVAVVECGFAWLPSLMWRVDKDWKGLRQEVPWVRKAPSEYIYERVRFSTQPVDVPADPPGVLEGIIKQVHGADLLMYASDYPHRYTDDLTARLPLNLPADAVEKIMGGNARALYDLP